MWQYDKTWREIYTDGRPLPTNVGANVKGAPDPRYWGYSVGHWEDDYTFVVESTGFDPRSWLDNAGRPHTDEMKVEEVFHRASRDRLEMSVTIDDPKYYSKPWVAIDKMQFQLMPPDTPFLEMMCSPSELAEYNKKHANLGNKK